MRAIGLSSDIESLWAFLKGLMAGVAIALLVAVSVLATVLWLGFGYGVLPIIGIGGAIVVLLSWKQPRSMRTDSR